MRINRRLIANLDWVVVGAVLVLTLSGIMTIYSATRPLAGGGQPSFYMKQIYWLLVGLLAMAAVVSFDYLWIRRAAPVLYGLGLGLLVAVLVMGSIGMGAQRWISLGPVSFQPSEVFKLFFIVMLARHMSMIRGSLGFGDVMKTFFAFVFVPFVMLVKQPDLGTALIMLLIFTLMSLGKGVGRSVLILAVVIAMVSVPFVGSIVWDGLKDYQKKRIIAFVKPDVDPDGISYHIKQSKVAVGSGGVLGKGYLKGTQGPFRFLPEKHTDFVFSVFAEERGFAGSVFLLLTYLVLILRGLDTAYRAKDDFGRLLALGVTLMFTLYVLINIGMTLGLTPVVGIPLPFMSYGGTALVSNFMAAGVLISVRARRFELFY
ncbi:MAG: rod shape-determining protein RodA [Thermodesulfovibrionales bacterium]